MTTSSYIIGTILALVIFFGICGNLLVIMLVKTEKRLVRSNYYYLVFILAVYDALHLLTAVRINFSNLSNNWPLQQTYVCKIWQFCELFFCSGGIQTMVLICVLRYFAVLHPLKATISRKNLKKIILCLNMIMAVFLVPFVFAFKHSKSRGCYTHWPNKTLGLVYTAISICIHYITPVLLMFVLYFKIYHTLVQQTKTMITYRKNETDERKKDKSFDSFERVRHSRNTRIFVTSLVTVCAFTLSALPFEVWWYSTTNNLNVFSYFYKGAFFILYVIGSSAVNPYIYGMLDKKLIGIFKQNRNKKPAINQLAKIDIV